MSIYENLTQVASKNEVLFHLGKAIQLTLLKAKGLCAFGREKTIQEHLATHKTKKLQLGIGLKLLDGWLNTDCSIQFAAKCFLDVTEPFPCEDNTWDYIFTEHLIEHLTFEQGFKMLQECHRVLKPGGSIRVACPELRRIMAILEPQKTDEQNAYIQYTVEKYFPHVGGRNHKSAFVINNAVRNWGHQFIYDKETLRETLAGAGFQNIQEFNPGESNDPFLTDLETYGPNNIPKTYETQVFQAQKSARP